MYRPGTLMPSTKTWAVAVVSNASAPVTETVMLATPGDSAKPAANAVLMAATVPENIKEVLGGAPTAPSKPLALMSES
jgi:hypothetical protein